MPVKYILSFWGCKSSIILEFQTKINIYRGRDFSFNQSLMSVKTENIEAYEWLGVVYDDFKIKNEEVDLKEEDLLEINSQR